MWNRRKRSSDGLSFAGWGFFGASWDREHRRLRHDADRPAEGEKGALSREVVSTRGSVAGLDEH